MIPRRAVRLSEDAGYHVLRLDDDGSCLGRTVIVASGVEYRRLDVPHLADYEGIGVAYAVAAIEEELQPAASAVVVGGANSAGQAALSLAAAGHHVYLVVRGSELGKEMARYLVDRIERESSVDVLLECELHGVAVELDERGFVVTGPGLSADARTEPAWQALGRDPFLLETSCPGVFAAGDVRSGSVKRVATAAGEGSMAVRFAQEYLLSEGSVTRGR